MSKNSYLDPLLSIGTPNLINFDKDLIVEEIITRIQSDPNWNSIWDGELLSNASYMIMNIFAYLFSKNAEATNRLIREVFINEARDPRSISNIIRSYGVNIKQNTASVAPVSVLTTLGGNFSNSFFLNPGFSLSGTNIDGLNVNYELYLTDSLNSSKIDYRSPIQVQAGIKNVFNAFSGVTVGPIEIEIDSSINREKFIYKIKDINVIEDSIRIFYQYGNPNETELIETDTFVVSPIVNTDFPDGIPHFKLQYFDDGSCDIIFGTKAFGGYFPNDCTLTLFYRIGGGAVSNVPIFGINQPLSFVPLGATSNITALFRNEMAGKGGSDREDINEAQFYAPHRVGRGKAIVDDTDVLNELISIIVKHSVVSPKPNENELVPILHYWNYIAPIRTFDDFLFPVPSVTDNLNTYKIKFENAINLYLNLVGMHDGEESNILTTTFDSLQSTFTSPTFSSFDFTLQKKPALNGTLKVEAYNRYNEKIDSLYWTGNYTSGVLSSDSINTKAFILCNNASSINITTLINDQFVIKIDESGPLKKLTIPSGGYTPSSLANALDILLKASDPYYSSFSSSFFSTDSSNKIIISSQIFGENSLIILDYDNLRSQNFLINDLAIPNKKYVDASPQNSKVFNSSLFDFTNSTVRLDFNSKVKNETPRVIDSNTNNNDYANILPKISFWSNSSSSIGQTISFFLKDMNNRVIHASQGTDVIVSIYGYGIKKSELIFSSIQYSNTNSGTSLSIGTNTDPFDSVTLANYNWTTGEITFKMIDDPIGYTGSASADETFTSTGVSGVFTLSYNPGSSAGIEVYKNSSIQTIGIDWFYSTSLNTITMTSLSPGDNILVKFFTTLYSFPKDTINIGQDVYNTSFSFDVSFVEKEWQYITHTYTPDPYYAEGETFSILNKLRGTGKRMIGMEPLIKKTKFTPLSLGFNVIPMSGKTKSEVQKTTKDLIYQNFSYSNTNKDMKIGEVFSVSKALSLLNDRNLNPSSQSVSLFSISKTSCDANEYQFIFPESFILKIRSFEINNGTGVNLSGLADLYEPKVN